MAGIRLIVHQRAIQTAKHLGLSTLLLTGVLSVASAHHDGLPDQLIADIKARFGNSAERRLHAWQQMIHNNLDLPEREKLEVVNRFFNQRRFVDDIDLWGKTDYWATPAEFLGKDAGDCEDFSIAKYFALKDMGLDTKKLRITYVKALDLNQAHMVLAYYPTPTSVPLILDNLTGRIVTADRRTDLQPVYSFNADELWLSRTRNEQIRAGEPSQLGKWQELNQRLNRETRAGNPRETASAKKPKTESAADRPPAPATDRNTPGSTEKNRIDGIKAGFAGKPIPGISRLSALPPPQRRHHCQTDSIVRQSLAADLRDWVVIPCRKATLLARR